MNKPIKDWGAGIPVYSEDDILEGVEFHAFCTNAVAKQMQNDGYTIEGVIINNTPTQVIANKNGKRFFVIVAGDLFPYEGKISWRLKQEFSLFCKRQNVIPMFASVGLMPCDPVRAEKRLALKYDGYYVKYLGNEDLSIVNIPEKLSEGFKEYCVEKIIDAYCSGHFEPLYDYFDDEIQFHSQWVFNPLIGKKALIEYFDGKGKTLRNSNTELNGVSVVIAESQKRNGNFVLMSKPGTICALIGQKLNGKNNMIFITPKFNERDDLVELSLNDPGLFSFKKYYSFE